MALAWPLRPESSTSVILPALSPFIAVAAAISGRAVSVLALLAVPVVLLVLVIPRWFCRHGCPVGLLQEMLENRMLRWRRRTDDEPRPLTPALSVEGAPKAGDVQRPQNGFRPAQHRRRRTWPRIGQWLVLLTLGGALLGYPLFLWLDPLAIFNGFLNAGRQPIALATLLTGLGLPLLLLLDVIAPRWWCQRICPLGATQDLLAWPRRRWRRHSRCEELAGVDDGRDALGDRRPLTPSLSPAGSEGGGKSGRRWFLAAFAGAAGALAVRAVRGQTPTLLRPPGALDELRFTGVCVRCGNCAQVCPAKIIQPDFGASGVAGFLTPQLRFDQDYCREDCHRCTEVCPSGAIGRLSLADKRRHMIGRAVVDLELCLLAQGRECTACIQKCPYEAIAMASADGGFSNQPDVIPDRCNGCGACEAVCPTQPRRAVRVLTLATAKDYQEGTHRAALTDA